MRLAMGVVALAAMLASFWAHPVAFDDAFITFKYAASLAQGTGLVFNVEDGPLEGFSNLSWVVLNAGAIAAGLEPAPFSQSLGLIALAATVALLWRRGQGVMGALLAIAVLVASLRMPHYVALAGSGLETSFAALAIVLCGVWLRSGRTQPALFLALGVLLVTTRPDGALFLGAMAVAAARPVKLDRVLRFVALALIPIAALTVFRVVIFHDVVPNTFHAKAADAASWPAGLLYWWAFARNSPHVIGCLGVWLGSILLRRKFTPLDVFGVLSLTGYALYVARVGGDFMFYRFGFQIVPLVFLLTVEGITALALPLRVVSGVGVCALLWWGSGKPVVEEQTFGMQSIDTMNSFVAPGREVGLALKAALPADTRISTTLAGTVPYYSGLFTIDEWGLNDRVIARLPSKAIVEKGRGHVKHATSEYLDRRRVNLELGHPTICDCSRPCDEAFPQVHLKLDERRCLRMRYRTQTPALTKLFCTSPKFLVRHFDCAPTAPPFEWKVLREPDEARVEDELEAQALPAAQLIAHRHGVAFGSSTVTAALVGQTAVTGTTSAFLNSFHGGDATTGWIDVPLDSATRRVRLRVGGGKDCQSTFVGIVVGRSVVARVCGADTEAMAPAVLEVPEGEGARLVIVDMATGGWGHLLVGDVELERLKRVGG